VRRRSREGVIGEMDWLDRLLAAILPLSGWLRQNPHQAPKLWMLMGFCPCTELAHLDMALISWLGAGLPAGRLNLRSGCACTELYLGAPRTRHAGPVSAIEALYFFPRCCPLFRRWTDSALFYSCNCTNVLVYATVARDAPIRAFRSRSEGHGGRSCR